MSYYISTSLLRWGAQNHQNTLSIKAHKKTLSGDCNLKIDAPDTDAKIQDAETDAKIQRDAVDWHHTRQTGLMQQVHMMEQMVEDKEEKLQQEIQQERELRNEDARTSALREKFNSNETLREKKGCWTSRNAS